MKTTISRLQAHTTTVPHFIALLGVLHEAATRGLSLLPEAPAPRRLHPSTKTAAAGTRP